MEISGLIHRLIHLRINSEEIVGINIEDHCDPKKAPTRSATAGPLTLNHFYYKYKYPRLNRIKAAWRKHAWLPVLLIVEV